MRLESAVGLLVRAIESPEEERLLPDGLLAGPGGLGVSTGLAVYRANIRGARERALRDAFPVCEAVLGADCFGALAATWIAQTPSRDGDLNRHGEAFPAWLETFARRRPELAGLPYLGELACLEWARHSALYADDASALDVPALVEAASTGATIRLAPAPSLRLMVADWPVRELVELHLNGSLPQTLAALAEPERLAIWRAGGTPRIEAISERAWRLLVGSRNGLSLDQIAGADPAIAACLGELLQTAVRKGWLAGFLAEDGRV